MDVPVYMPVIKPGRPRIDKVYQLVAQTAELGAEKDSVFKLAENICWQWLSLKFFNDPEMDPPKESVMHRVPGQSLEVRIVQERGLWTARLEQPDTPFRGRRAMPGRNWVTDISLSLEGSRLKVVVYVICATVGVVDASPPFLTRPRVAVVLAQNLHLAEERELSDTPWRLQSKQELEQLRELLGSRSRTIPVIVITESAPDAELSSSCLVDAAWLAAETQTLAHVVVLPHELSFAWTDLVTERWSVYGGAVRTYRPRLDFNNDSKKRHPLVLPAKIREWRYEEIVEGGVESHVGAQAFMHFLVEKAKRNSADKVIQHPIYVADARAIEARLKREKAKRDTEEDFNQYLAEIEAANAKCNELQGKLDAADAALLAQKEECDSYKDENWLLRERNRRLSEKIRQRKADESLETESIPLDYPSLCDYVDEELVDGLILHPKAKRGLKNSRYEDSTLVYNALLLLATKYREMRTGDDDAKRAFENECQSLGLQLGRAVSKTRAGQEGEEYWRNWHGRRFLLQDHLKKGDSRDERRCLRIYFFWDDDEQIVVVGWLTSHLDTSHT